MSNALQIQDELAAALEALDKLDLAFGRVFGLSGLEATDLINHATDLVNEVGEVAHRSTTLKHIYNAEYQTWKMTPGATRATMPEWNPEWENKL